MLALVVIAAFFEKEVGALFLRELNKSLKTELQVTSIDLSLLSDFPNASINLKDVQLPGAYKGSGMLLEAENLELSFGTMSVFSQKYKVKSIEIQNGALYLYFDKNGRNSADILLQSKTIKTEENSDFSLSLEKASLQDIEIIYVNEQKKTEISVKVNDAEVDGEFSNEQFSMNSFAEMYSGFVDTPEGRFMAGTELGYTAKIDVNLKTGIYKFDEVEVVVDNNTFKVDGQVEAKESYSNVDIVMKSKDCSIKSVIGVLPPAYKKKLSDFDSQGTFFLTADVKGKYSASRTPAVDVKFGLKNGKINSPRLDYPLKDVSFKASFKNGKEGRDKDAVFEINGFQALMKKEPLKMNLKAIDLNNPYIDFNFSGNVPLDAVYGLFDKESISDGDGKINFNNLNIAGYYKYMTDPKLIYKVDATGELELNEVMLRLNNEKIYVESGKLIMSNNDFQVKKVNFKGVDSEITLDGSAKNLIPVLLSDSINSKDAKLEFQLNLDAKNIDFDQLFALGNLYNKEEIAQEKETGENPKKERFTNYLEGSFTAKIDEFNYRKVIGKDFRGKVDIKDKVVAVRGVRVDALDGTLNMDGKVFLTNTPSLETTITCHQIDAEETFRQCENFGQKVVTEDNIRGKINAKVLVKAYWDENGDFLEKKLYTIADVSMEEGELIDFEMLESLSKYVNLQDLQHVKFSKTRNQFGILRGNFYIPTMFIQSNALNLSLSGNHKLSGNMDYLVKVNAGQVLWNKFKRYNPKKKPKKAKKKGFFNIYVNVTGDLEEYDYKYGKKNYNALNDKLEYHFERIRRDIRNELGQSALLEPIDWNDGDAKDAPPKRKPTIIPKKEEREINKEEDPNDPVVEKPQLEKTKAEKLETTIKTIFAPTAKPQTGTINNDIPEEEIPDEEYDPELDEEMN